MAFYSYNHLPQGRRLPKVGRLSRSRFRTPSRKRAPSRTMISSAVLEAIGKRLRNLAGRDSLYGKKSRDLLQPLFS